MAAFALEAISQTRYYVRLDAGVTGHEPDQALILDPVRTQTGSAVAVLYVFQTDTAEVNALTVRAEAPARMKDVGVTLTADSSRWLETLNEPAQGRPLTEANFEKFPEVLQYQLGRLLVAPLRAGEQLLGLLTLGRTAETAYEPNAFELARRAGRLLTAVLERDSLQQKLLERKLIERAKGILQQRRRLSEEQSYLLLRNNSRRRRMPMADLAKEIIETSQLPGTFSRDHLTSQTRRWQAV